jgi:hypothetical protein
MDSTYDHTKAMRPVRIREMLRRDSLVQKHVRAMLTLVDKLADMQCCCPIHGAIFSVDEYLASAEYEPDMDYGCPGGDCDGCPDCLSGQARRIIVRLGCA